MEFSCKENKFVCDWGKFIAIASLTVTGVYSYCPWNKEEKVSSLALLIWYRQVCLARARAVLTEGFQRSRGPQRGLMKPSLLSHNVLCCSCSSSTQEALPGLLGHSGAGNLSRPPEA